MENAPSQLTSMELTQIRNLLERDAVRQVLEGYARGNDRGDEAIMRSAYWDDGYDDHGPFKGNAQDFITWALPLGKVTSGHQHFLGQSVISVEGDQASAETYFVYYAEGGRAPLPNVVSALAGRYVDTLERRGGVWKILHRVTVVDWSTVWRSDERFWDVEKFVSGDWYPNDQIYKKPV
jgi:hypothetical protein